jgi:cyclic lactone autoinducer peptide
MFRKLLSLTAFVFVGVGTMVGMCWFVGYQEEAPKL